MSHVSLEERPEAAVSLPLGFSVSLNWSMRDVIWTIWLTAEWRVVNKRHCTTAICSFWSHGIDANNHSDNTTIEEKEPKNSDGDDTVEEDRMFRLPLDIAILVDLGRHTRGAGGHQHHNELNQ